MLKATVVLEGVDARIDDLAETFKRRANHAVEILWNELYQEVQINLSNNILNIRTGNLIGSMEYTSYIQSYSDVISAQVGTSTSYAAYQEFGYAGVINLAKGGTRTVNYAGKPYIRPALLEIAKNVGAVLNMELNNGD